MKLIIPGRLPCMNDLIAANRLNKYAGAGVNDSRKYVHLTQEVFTDRENPRIEITIKGG